MLRLLFWRRARSLRNTLAFLTPYEWTRDVFFTLAGFGLLYGLYCGFYRLLAYLASVPLIGALLLWKLTAMLMLTTMGMVVISSLLTSLSTLYYSYDLKFLMKTPLDLRTIFVDKSLEAIFFSSWMIALVLVPYVSALVIINGLGWKFFAAFVALMAPFLMLAAAVGVAFTMVVLYLFPSSLTRDVIWVLSSLSMTLVYGLIRFAQPEKLIRPDALRVVADYLNFLQAPTAPYLPSWWITKALSSLAGHHYGVFWRYAVLLCAAAALAYGVLVWLAGRIYFAGYSGAQEGPLRRRPVVVEPLPERRWLSRALAALFWRERKAFFRDVKHWSQILLVLGLIFVYLFSIQRMPLESPDLRSLVSFLNIGTAGFVIAALGLRFTYPSISLEGRSWWVLASAPITVREIMRQKLVFSLIPMTAMALILGATTNYLLHADRFTAWISLGSLLVITWALCAMGVGFGSLFPMFTVENIHQIESSMGGFVYMAASLFYIGADIMILSWPMEMHFQERFGNAHAWHRGVVVLCAGCWVVLNSAAFAVPWLLGRRALEVYEAH
jgi:ABC-2 type transport system permease protein